MKDELGWDGRPEDWEYPDEGESDSAEIELVACPKCGSEIYEEAVQCHHCGTYVTFSSSPFEGKPIAWVVLGLLGIGAVVWSLLM